MDILGDLTPAQIEAVTHVDGPLLVLAGAGSGKTRVITRRIAHLMSQGVPPQDILAITFTNKAAGEMRERTEALVPDARPPLVTTFHSFCARMLRQYADLVGLDPRYTIYDTADQKAAIKRVLGQLNLDPTHFDPGRCAETISRAKNHLQRARDYGAGPRTDFAARNLARIYEAYEAILSESHALDFDDLLLEVALGLRERPEFRAELHERFRYILIDEYQDTNHAQYVIARDLAGERRNLCATGDPDQSIYGWRGAQISNILDFEKDFPDACVVRLEMNYRSTKTILAAADAVIRHNRDRKPKGLFTDNPAGSPLAVVQTDDEEAEAASIVRRIGALREKGLTYRDVAVFVRTGAQTRAIEDAFRRGRPPIPYEVVRGTSFYERKEVRDILAYLEVLHNGHDEVNARRIINTPPRGIGGKTVEALAAWARREGVTLLDALPHAADMADLATRACAAVARFRELMDRLREEPHDSLRQLIGVVIDETGYAEALKDDEARERRENLDELVTLGEAFDREAAAHPDDPDVPRGLEGFLQTVALSSDQDGYDESPDRVPLMTLHSAKGLEFPAVFITGCEDGLLPHARSRESRAEVEEERRLFFVGMTRAKQFLTLTHARFRRIRGRLERCIRSPFLSEIPQETAEQRDETTGTSPAPLDGGSGYTAPGADRVVRPERDAATGFAVGEVVRHPTYGIGRIARFATAAGQRMVRVRFNTVGEKLLDPRFARLVKVADA
ncbi:MAG TPA: UvrD-helicase domain-containing protein [Phycisphaerae bacterium]|nr:UvrD-helicase domain-containing protein [Phycisphaerae bacterium]